MIRFGSWFRLYSEAQLLQQFAPFNLSLRSLRLLLSNLGVPSIHIGNQRLVDGFSLFLALRAVLSIGEPDFVCPNSMSHRKGTEPSKINLLNLRARYRRLVADLLYAKRFNGMTLTDSEIRRTADLALARLQQNAYRLALTSVVKSHQDKADILLREIRKGAP